MPRRFPVNLAQTPHVMSSFKCNYFDRYVFKNEAFVKPDVYQSLGFANILLEQTKIIDNLIACETNELT